MKILHIVGAVATFAAVVVIMNVATDWYAPTYVPATVSQKTCACRTTIQEAYTRSVPLITFESLRWKDVKSVDQANIGECRCQNVPTTKRQMQVFNTSYTVEFVDEQMDKTYSYSFHEADRYRDFMKHRYWSLKVSHDGKVLDVYPLPEQ